MNQVLEDRRSQDYAKTMLLLQFSLTLIWSPKEVLLPRRVLRSNQLLTPRASPQLEAISSVSLLPLNSYCGTIQTCERFRRFGLCSAVSRLRSRGNPCKGLSSATSAGSSTNCLQIYGDMRPVQALFKTSFFRASPDSLDLIPLIIRLVLVGRCIQRHEES